ncbi:MAG: hypothetical protein FJX52_15955, partial [Alphaproteobacteria bacterium]|nr:hypothetical protein [Alphaproteobacteria bacterium]
MTRLGPFIAFALTSVIWGASWMPAKIGVSYLPPLFFTGSRFMVAGLLIACWLRWCGRPFLPPAPLYGRVGAVALLAVAASPGMVFWGLVLTPSAIGAVVNLSLIPVGLYAIGRIVGEERRSARMDVALLVGIAGLVLLFAPRLELASHGLSLHSGLAGIAVIALGTFVYAWGTVIGCDALRGGYSAVAMSAATNFVGGAGLVVVSLIFERPDLSVLLAPGAAPIWWSWLFLLGGGSLIAYPASLWLLREWGPVRSGLYAF